MDRALGRLLAYAVMAGLLLLLIAVGAFFVECATWGQCPSFENGPGAGQAQGPHSSP